MNRESQRGGLLTVNHAEFCIEAGDLFTHSIIIENPTNPYYFTLKTGEFPIRITGDLHGNAEITVRLFTDSEINSIGTPTDIVANGLKQNNNDFVCYYGTTVISEGTRVLNIAGYGATPSANAASQSRIGKFEIAKNTEVLLKMVTTATSVNLVVEAGRIKTED